MDFSPSGNYAKCTVLTLDETRISDIKINTNVTLKLQASPAPKPEFPVLMEYVGSSELNRGGVVLFLGRKEGIAMKGMDSAQIGTVEKDWVAYDDMSVWRKYEGVVELSN